MAKKSVKPERVRVQPMIDENVAMRLDELAKNFGWTRNQAAEWVLNLGTADLNYLIKKLASKFFGPNYQLVSETGDNGEAGPAAGGKVAGLTHGKA